MHQLLHDKIAQICVDHFNGLPKTGKPNIREWTVLSCIVKQDTTLGHFEVVALGTGCKCIGKTQMSNKGDILNDSHAEIVCRRAFLKYIYEQIDCNSENIFISNFTIRSTIRFHFFTSHVPCGEAAIVPEEYGEPLLDEPDHKRIKLDFLCTGAKLLSEAASVRTKPGRGDPTLSVSCSDKLAKWNCLGVQGALLMLILKQPIYLYSFTLARHAACNVDSLSRAFYGRYVPFIAAAPYLQHKMFLGEALIEFSFHKVDNKQPCPSSIIWSKTKRSLEVAVDGKKQGVTKKNKYLKSGRLQISKIELFRTFLNIANNLNLYCLENITNIKYFEAKMKAKEYQDAWKILKSDVFKKWTIKDNALLQFNLD